MFTFGEAMIRLSVPPGHTLEFAPSFDVHVAGAEANVAATLARLGRSVSWVSKVPENSLGRRVISALEAAGVDCSGVARPAERRMGTYFVELHPEPLPTRIIYDRADSAAASFTLDDVTWPLFERAGIVHLSGITPALSPSCREVVTEMANRARAGNMLLSVDVNYRAQLWTPEEAAATISPLISEADLVVCTSEDAADLYAIGGDPAEAAGELAGVFDAKRAVVTSGAEGAWWHERGTTGHVSSIPVSVIDRIGAGDAFMAGVLDGILDGDLALGVRRGAALAAFALASYGDQAVVTRERMESLLDGTGRRVDR